MIVKKKVRIEQEFLKCDFCDKITEETSGKHYIEECPGCGLHVCPDHRELAAVTPASAITIEVCPNCLMIWKVIALYDKTKKKIKKGDYGNL